MKLKLVTGIALSMVLFACGGDKSEELKDEKSTVETETAAITNPLSDKGVGPITSVTLGDINEALVEQGKEVFKAKCTACHKIEKRFVGPAIKGVTERRSPEWIMNMILNPEVMVVENQAAKQLLIEYTAPMANQGLTEEEARAILEFFRTKI